MPVAQVPVDQGMIGPTSLRGQELQELARLSERRAFG